MPTFDGVRLQRLDQRQIKRLMARSTALEAYLQDRLDEGKTFAESISPDGPPFGSGYKFSWVTRIRQGAGGVPTGRLINTSPIWIVVEKGAGILGPEGRPRQQGGYSPPFHVMARTFWHLVGTSRTH